MTIADELLDPFTRMLDEVSPPEVLRAVETGGKIDALWSTIAESGFLDALVPEEQGGAALGFAEVGALIHALGSRLVPAPVAQSMAARALLAAAGIERPDGPIILVTPVGNSAAAVPLATVATHALVDLGERLVLTDLADALVTPTGVHGSESADIMWSEPVKGPVVPAPDGRLRPIAACLRALEIAGACRRLLTMTVAYANERSQFGKPIGQQQAIQQQLAVMAEQTMMAWIAAQIGCAAGFPPPIASAAVAKQISSAAAVQVTAIAHAVHGAIGFSEELDLQLYTRRLYEWRSADGTEGYWAGVIGRQRLANEAMTSVDFVREAL